MGLVVVVGTGWSGWSGAQPDGVSAYVNLPLHQTVQNYLLALAHRKTVVVVPIPLRVRG